MACNTGRLFLRDLRRRGEISFVRALRALSWLAKYHLALDGPADVAGARRRLHARQVRAGFRRAVPAAGRGRGAAAAAAVPGARRDRAAPRATATCSRCCLPRRRYIVGPVAGALASRRWAPPSSRWSAGSSPGSWGPACFGSGKIHWAEDLGARRQSTSARSWFYTDSYTDLPMLERVGNRVVVNPDPRLRRTARTRGWPVEDWRRAAG